MRDDFKSRLIPLAAAAFATAAAFLFSMGWGAIFLLLVPAAGACITRAAGAFGHRRKAWIALEYIAHAIRLEQPLPETLGVAAEGEPGARRVLWKLQNALRDGGAVGDALRSCAPGLGSRCIEIVATGERSGRLGETVERVLNERRQRNAERRDAPVHPWIYPLLLLIIAAHALVFYSAIVLPKFIEIVEDDGGTPPRVTQFLVDLPDASQPLVLVTTFVLTYLVVGGIVGLPYGSLAALVDIVLGWLPPLRGMKRDRDLADAMGVMASASRAGVPLASALNEASQLRLSVRTRRALLGWQDRIEHGAEVGPAAREAGMPAIVGSLVGSAAGPRGVEHALDFLARYYGGRFSRAAIAVAAIATPAAIALVGCVVAALAMAVFLPIVQMVERASMTPGLGT